MKDVTNVVTEDNIDNFMIDFKTWLSMAIQFKKIKELKGLVKLDISKFKWEDDGKHDLGVHIKSKDNAATIDIRFKGEKNES
jgi:hypothetical protein